MRVIALPVKALAEAKSRLDPMLTPLERGALTLAMLEDVMDVGTPGKKRSSSSSTNGTRSRRESRGPIMAAARLSG